jgi:hypothetical protein
VRDEAEITRRWEYIDKFRRRTKKGSEIHLTDLLSGNNMMALCRGVRNPTSLPAAGTQVYIDKCSELGVVPNSKVKEMLNLVRSEPDSLQQYCAKVHISANAV